ARLVAQGFRQKQGIDFETSYSPVVCLESIRNLLFLASLNNLTVEYYDSVTAYCQSKCSSLTFVHQPPGFVQPQEGGDLPLVMQLNKALYGLKCSGRDWNEHLNSILIAVGLTRSNYDPCIYFSRTDNCF